MCSAYIIDASSNTDYLVRFFERIHRKYVTGIHPTYPAGKKYLNEVNSSYLES